MVDLNIIFTEKYNTFLKYNIYIIAGLLESTAKKNCIFPYSWYYRIFHITKHGFFSDTKLGLHKQATGVWRSH